MSRSREVLTIGGTVAAVAAITATLSAVGPSDRGPLTRAESAAAATSTGLTRVGASAATPGAPPGLARLEAGDAQADPVAAAATDELAPARERTVTGAVEAFVAAATWVIGSPAAEAHPADAARVVSDVLNPADREMLRSMPRTGGADLDARRGAYRVLGHAGDERRPDAVMVELSAPLTAGGTARWLVAGGVVRWADGEWQIESLRPRDAGVLVDDSVTGGRASATSSSTATTDAAALPGLGWTQFANSGLG